MQRLKSIWEYILHVREKSKVINKSGLYVAFSLISVYALIMSIVCFVKANITMGIVNVVISLGILLIMTIFTNIKSPKLLAWFVVTFFYVLMMFFLCEGGVGGVSIMWLLFVPMAGMALINLYYGGILSLLLGLSIPLYMLTPLYYVGYQYSEDYRIRFPIIYWAFLIMALFIFIRVDRYEEQQKEMIKKSEEANQSKSSFLANMSHEIRTPMNAIMGLCELNMNEELSPIVLENSRNIHRAGKSLMNIVNDLLDFSKIESGKMELQCKEYKLSDVLNDIIYMIVARMGKKKLEFVVDCDPDIPNVLYGDEVRIRQIMINLLTNALKYTKEGGFLLSLSCRKETYGINLIISVKDSGIGIKKENMGKLFDAYGRFDAEKNHAIEGTGLGLPITKKLIKLMNGVVKISSEYGKGTEFLVVIPQKVVEETPIVTFECVKDVHILYYQKEEIPAFVGNAYNNSFKTVLERLGAKGHRCENFEELEEHLSKESFSHIIIGKAEYTENKSYYDALSEKYCLAVIQEQSAPVSIGANVVSIYKPFYTKNFSDFINRKYIAKEQKNAAGVFAAPAAKVLVVDDNMFNLTVACGLLKMYQIMADTATSGEDAIERMKNKEYDLVFMDHLMPGMDGIETHRQLRKAELIKDVPMIALTANVAEEAKVLFMEEGFRDFMSKPIQTEVLREMLLKWLKEDLVLREKEQINEG